MRVLSLSQMEFAAACTRLGQELLQAEPQAVVAVRTGGWAVVEQMPQVEALGLARFGVTARRTSTTRKEALNARRLLTRLPRWVTDRLRVWEHVGRERRFLHRGAEDRQVTLPKEFVGWLREEPRSLVVVDDAVDTGSSLEAVIRGILTVAPRTRVRTAAIVQTFREPLVKPDYVLYRNMLVRFPWSMDVGP